jgi:hypothetical protein
MTFPPDPLSCSAWGAGPAIAAVPSQRRQCGSGG